MTVRNVLELRFKFLEKIEHITQYIIIHIHCISFVGDISLLSLFRHTFICAERISSSFACSRNLLSHSLLT